MAVQTAAMMGLVTAVLGGRPGMVTGAAGAVATASRDVVQRNGTVALFYAVIMMGAIELVSDQFKPMRPGWHRAQGVCLLLLLPTCSWLPSCA